ncbi:MAG: DVUA0089 family protein [Phycisphaerales bacterium]|nr:MAG: DVUA0089 family protein [Phycisphaerales bacterium]
MRLPLAAVLVSQILASGSALAQPTSIDLGDISSSQGDAIPISVVSPGQIQWYRLAVSVEFSLSTERQLTISTTGITGSDLDDTEIGLYRSTGQLVASDDDDGIDRFSQLRFGGVVSAGPDGPLDIGTYYLAVGGYNMSFAPNFGASSTSLNTGPFTLRINADGIPIIVWNEVSGEQPAGETLETAQIPLGAGPLRGIMGTLGPNQADVYKINICSPIDFAATTVGYTTLDTQLYLFDENGMGVTFNDDASSSQSLLTNQFVTEPGNYYLAISELDRDPSSATGPIWLDDPFDIERAPDGPGAAGALNSWASDFSGSGGSYIIRLFGTCFPTTTPECVADVDDGNGTGTPDGAVTIDDLLYYISIFQQGASSADVDDGTGTGVHDGAVTIDDLLYYLVRFQDGC